MKIVKAVLTLIVFLNGKGISYTNATLLRGSNINSDNIDVDYELSNDDEDIKIAAVEEEAKMKMAAVKKELNMEINTLKKEEAINLKAIVDEKKSKMKALTKSYPPFSNRVEIYGGIWGQWKSWAGRSRGSYACGAELRFEDSCGSCDDTAGNGLKLKFCRLDNWNSQITDLIGNGFWGDWKGMKMCPFGKYIGGARVRFEDSIGRGDDTALNGLEIRCVDRYWKEPEDIMVYSGVWGDWKPWVISEGQFVENARVRIEDMQGSGDDTALNGIEFSFRNVPSPLDLPTPICGVIENNEYSGTASSIDTDGSGGFVPTTGDISIAVSLVPKNPSLGSTVSIKAVCVLTAEDPTASAPFCTFENSLSLAAGNGAALRDTLGTTIAIGTPPLLAITGGTRDFYGAYGEIITGEDFKFEQLGRGKIQLSFSATINYCIPARSSPPTPAPTTAPTTVPTLR